MAHSYKLHYFDGRGRAEVARFLFAQAGVDYEDVRHPHDPESFGKLKADRKICPLGQLPSLVVTIDDEEQPAIPQSMAIARYLARKFGMDGESVKEKVQVDVACECVTDLFNLLYKIYFYEKDDSKKPELKKNFIEKDSVAILDFACNSLDKNKQENDGSGFFVGKKMTLADIMIFSFTDTLVRQTDELNGILTKYPKLKAFDDHMRAQPNIKAWLDKRPDTQF